MVKTFIQGRRRFSYNRLSTVITTFGRAVPLNDTMKAVLILAVVLLVAGCSTFRFPGVHRITVQQGNVVSQAMIDKLRPGMTKSQVRFILGNPVVDDSLDQDRWDYIYTIQVAGGEVIRRLLVLHFREERLSYFEGDFLPSDFLPSDSLSSKKSDLAATVTD